MDIRFSYIAAVMVLLSPGHASATGHGRKTILPYATQQIRNTGTALRSLESVPKAPPLYGKADTASVLIIGDIMLHSKQMAYPYSTFLEGIRDRMLAADITVANMEFTLAGKPYTGYPAFSAPDSYAEYVADCGTDVFLTANNHIIDKGNEGLERTMRVYRDMEKSRKIHFTGTSGDEAEDKARYPLIISTRGIRIALINFTYGTNAPSGGDAWPKVNRLRKDDIAAAFGRAHERMSDFIIVLPHWGNEYQLRHSTGQRALAEWLVSEGADAIIGSHPHVVQDSCSIGECPVFYSVGNAISNMSAENTQIELAVELIFTRSENGDVTMLKPEITYLWCSRPGGLADNYKVIAVRDYIGKKEMWNGHEDYDRMVRTYRHVKAITGVND